MGYTRRFMGAPRALTRLRCTKCGKPDESDADQCSKCGNNGECSKQCRLWKACNESGNAPGATLSGMANGRNLNGLRRSGWQNTGVRGYPGSRKKMMTQMTATSGRCQTPGVGPSEIPIKSSQKRYVMFSTPIVKVAATGALPKMDGKYSSLMILAGLQRFE